MKTTSGGAHPARQIQSNDAEFPGSLRKIPTPPVSLFVRGAKLDNLLTRPRIAIVGSRRVTPYGKIATTRLATDLARAGVVIVSGLALGVDSLAHRAALEAGGLTIAVLPASVEQIYPSSHYNLAMRLLENGGALVSEYPRDSLPYRPNFVARNRLVSGLSDGLLVVEAAIKSGTMHTVRFATEQGRDVFAVPGNITSPLSEGTNNLIKHGAAPVTCAEDVLLALGWSLPKTAPAAKPRGDTPEEDTLLQLLTQDITDGDDLLTKSQLDISKFNHTLTMLEITGKIRALGNNHWTVV